MGREAGGQVPWNAGGWVGRLLCLLFRAGGRWGAWWDLVAEPGQVSRGRTWLWGDRREDG